MRWEEKFPRDRIKQTKSKSCERLAEQQFAFTYRQSRLISGSPQRTTKLRQWLMHCESRGSGTARISCWMPRQNYPSYSPCKFKEPANIKICRKNPNNSKLFMSHNDQIHILRGIRRNVSWHSATINRWSIDWLGKMSMEWWSSIDLDIDWISIEMSTECWEYQLTLNHLEYTWS